MRGKVVIEPAAGGGLQLISIEARDLEELRCWKNDNRQAFFSRDEISVDGQRQWFEGYLERPGDFMFIVSSGALRAGCMGFRLRASAADCYNIIASPEGRGKGLLKAAMILMCSYIIKEHVPGIGLRVLIGNPAIGFYEKCGYAIRRTSEGFHEMEMSAAFRPIDYTRTP